MVQRMKVEPASPDQRVPSQSKTATLGERAWTLAWNCPVVSVVTAVGREDRSDKQNSKDETDKGLVEQQQCWMPSGRIW